MTTSVNQPQIRKLSESTSGQGTLPARPYDDVSEAAKNADYTYSGGRMLWAQGGCASNPFGFPGYEGYYGRGPWTYRFMMTHPINQLVRSINHGIIGASNWEVVGTEPGVPKAWIKFTQNNLLPFRDQLVAQFMMEGRDQGWASAELCWEMRDERLWFKKIKALLPEITEILVDRYGNPVGLQNQDPTGQPVRLTDEAKWWKYTYDEDPPGYVYGRSWLENQRTTAWKMWIEAMQQLQKLLTKISGIVTIVTSPGGTFNGPPDANGKPTQISYRKNAEALIAALANGAAGAWMPSLGLAVDAKTGNLDALRVLADLAGKSLTNVQVVDFGNHSAAISGILEQMRHAEELMFAAGERSARVGLEADKGSRADAEEHTDTGTLNAELDDRDFARQCQPLVDVPLVLNFGERARGKVKLKTPSLVDRKTAVLKGILLSVMNEPDVAEEIAATVDVDQALAALGVSTKKPYDAKAVRKNREKANKPSTTSLQKIKQPDKQGGRPTKE